MQRKLEMPRTTGAGEPSSADSVLLASVDETTPEVGAGIFYVVTAAILLAGTEDSATALAHVVAAPGRSRPFHWHTEGSSIRSAMMECLGDVGVCAHVHVVHPVGRKRQEQARSLGLSEVADHSIQDGVDMLLIESRQPDMDWRDSRTLARHADLGLRWEFGTKANPLLWAADAVCGAVREHLLGNDTYLDRLRDHGVLDDLGYGRLP